MRLARFRINYGGSFLPFPIFLFTCGSGNIIFINRGDIEDGNRSAGELLYSVTMTDNLGKEDFDEPTVTCDR